MLLPFIALGQQNNIYLFDCTGSMAKHGLWAPAKAALDSTISTYAQTPGTQFTVIPFGNNPYSTFTFNSEGWTDECREKIYADFDENIKRATLTNISDVLRAGFSHCKPGMENRIYLLTDGEPNGGDSVDKVVETINSWCGTQRNARLFYVALKEGVVNNKIRETIDRCKDAYVVEIAGNVIPQFADIDATVIYANIEELDRVHELILSPEDDCPLKADCNDPLFNVVVEGGAADNGMVRLRLVSRQGLTASELNQVLAAEIGEDRIYRFQFTLSSEDDRYLIANPVVNVEMANYIMSRAMVVEGANIVNLPGSTSYDSFLWSKEKDPDIVGFDLTPVFAKVTDPGARLVFDLIPEKGENQDYTLFFNGHPVEPGGVMRVVPGGEAIVAILFDEDAQEGERHFILRLRDSRGVDLVNDVPADEFGEIVVNSRYDEVLNPLKKFVVWLAVALLVALLLWLLVVRRMVFPPIKASRLELAGPDGYYLTKRIKGARKVVLTTRRRSQNIISRLMTGKVVYVTAPHFTPEIEIIPRSGKKVRVRPLNTASGGWDVIPSATLAPYEKGKLNHRTLGFKSEIGVQ